MISLSTFVSVLILFLSIIFFILVFSKKPTHSQAKEIEETGWEIIDEMKKTTNESLIKIENSKEELNKMILEFKNIYEKMNKEDINVVDDSEYGNIEKIIIEDSSEKNNIMRMYQKGHTIEEISKKLNIHKGIVEVSLNMERIKKHG